MLKLAPLGRIDEINSATPPRSDECAKFVAEKPSDCCWLDDGQLNLSGFNGIKEESQITECCSP